MAINYDRIILKSSLDKIVEGSEIRENIMEADRIIKRTLSEVSLIRLYGQKHGQTHWVEKAIEEKNLKTVGNYVVTTSGKSSKKIEFSQNGSSLIFYYTELEGTDGKLKAVSNMILEGRLDLAQLAMDGDDYQMGEMDCYELEKVELAVPSRIPFLKTRKTLYSKV